MKHIKLFENFEDNFKKYPNLFNLFVDPQYIKEKDFKAVDDLLYREIIARPFYFDYRLYDLDYNLNLYGTGIKELPDNLTVGGNLDLSETKIEELPDNLTVNDYLDLSYTYIKELPDNLRVGRDLYLYKSKIEKLPDNLTVNGNLDLRHTAIKDIPDSAIIKGKIYR